MTPELATCALDTCAAQFAPASRGGHEKRYCSRAHKDVAKMRRREAALHRARILRRQRDREDATND